MHALLFLALQSFESTFGMSSSRTSIPPISFKCSNRFSAFWAVFSNKHMLSKIFASEELQQRQYFSVPLHVFFGVSLITALLFLSSAIAIAELYFFFWRRPPCRTRAVSSIFSAYQIGQLEAFLLFQV